MTMMHPANLRSIEQYMDTREYRLQKGQIQNQSFYAFLGRLATGPIEALRLPIRTEVEGQTGAAALELCLLDMDLNVSSTNRGSIEDGLWRPASDDPFTVEYGDGRKHDLVEGYILDYDEGMGMPSMEQLESIRSPEEIKDFGYNPN